MKEKHQKASAQTAARHKEENTTTMRYLDIVSSTIHKDDHLLELNKQRNLFIIYYSSIASS